MKSNSIDVGSGEMSISLFYGGRLVRWLASTYNTRRSGPMPIPDSLRAMGGGGVSSLSEEIDL